MIATRSRPFFSMAYAAATPTLLNMQKPIERTWVAWWPQGRTAQKAFSDRPAIISSTANNPAPAARRAQGIWIHRGIGVELHIALGRRILENQIDIGRTMHPLEILLVGQRRLQAAQFVEHSGSAHLVIDRAQAGGTFGVSLAHLVAQAIRVGYIGRSHVP